jgi:broad specificity phosphatase PhoE
VASRLVLYAHGETSGTRELVFDDRSELRHPEAVTAPGRVLSWSCGPEPACAETARLMGGQPAVVPELANVDLGRWRGRTLAQVGEEDPDGLTRWMSDPHAAPHGGESLAELVTRVGSWCDGRDWPPGRHVAVVAPLVARAMAVHALAAAPEVIFRIDLAPLGRVGVSRSGVGWRLQQLG